MTTTLSEAESRRLVARWGVPVSPFVTGTTTAAVIDAVSADPAIGFPLAVKLCGRALAHKTERGLVRLGVPGPDALRAASDELLGEATPADGPVEVLATPMVSGSRELIAGVTRDPQYGLVVMLGLGGVLAELIGDVAFRLVPLTRVDAEEMIDDLAARAVLGEVRGEAAVSPAVVTDLIAALARTAVEVPGVAGIDLNPVIIDRGRPVAVDALVEVDDPSVAP